MPDSSWSWNSRRSTLFPSADIAFLEALLTIGVEDLSNDGLELTAAAFQNVKTDEREGVLQLINYDALRRDLGLKTHGMQIKSLRSSINQISKQKFEANNEEDERRAAAAVINIREVRSTSTKGLVTFLDKVDMRETKRILEYPDTELSLREDLIKAIKDARMSRVIVDDSEDEFRPNDSEEEYSADDDEEHPGTDDDLEVTIGNEAKRVVIDGSNDVDDIISISSDSDSNSNGNNTKPDAPKIHNTERQNKKGTLAKKHGIGYTAPRTIQAGTKRKSTDTADTASKCKKLNSVERSVVQSIEDASINCTRRTTMGAGVIDNDNARHRPTLAGPSSLLVRLKVNAQKLLASTRQPSLIVRLKVKKRHENPESYETLKTILRSKYPSHVRQPYRCGPHCPDYIGGLERGQQNEVTSATPTLMKYQGFLGLYEYDPNTYLARESIERSGRCFCSRCGAGSRTRQTHKPDMTEE